MPEFIEGLKGLQEQQVKQAAPAEAVATTQEEEDLASIVAELTGLVDKFIEEGQSVGKIPRTSAVDDDMNAFFSLAVERVDGEEQRVQMFAMAARLAEAAKAQGAADAEVRVTVSSDHAALEAELKEPLARAFTAWDADGDGRLSKQEASGFFSRYVEVVKHHTVSTILPGLCRSVVPQVVAQALRQIPYATMPAEQRAKVPEFLFSKMVPNLVSNYQKFLRMFESYAADPESHEQLAFAVVDKNQDGLLSLDEVLVALVPGSEHNKDFGRALGLAE